MNIKGFLLLALVLFVCVITGCRKNDKEAIISEIGLNSEDLITESFYLPKVLDNRDGLFISWISSDDRIIKIVEDEGGYKAIVLLPEYDVEMDLTAVINNNEEIYEYTYSIIVSKDDYKLISIDDIKNVSNGSLIKLDVVVIYSEDLLYAVADSSNTILFREEHQYSNGDNLIIKAKVQNQSLIIDKEEIISRDNEFDPYSNLDIKAIRELNILKKEDIKLEYLHRVIGNVSKVKDKYYLKSLNENEGVLEFEVSSEASYFDNKLIECLVIITDLENGLIKLLSSKIYEDHKYYFQDYEKVESVLTDIGTYLNGLNVSDIVLPEFDTLQPKLSWSSNEVEIKDNYIIHPNINIKQNIDVTVQIGDVVISKGFTIEFISMDISKVSEVKLEYINNGPNIKLLRGRIKSISNSIVLFEDTTGEFSIIGINDLKTGDDLFVLGIMQDEDIFKVINHRINN